jgi:cysteine synthase A
VKSGALKPGGTIVEGTGQEKKDALRLYGAELIEVPAKPYKNANNYIKISGRLAEKLNRELPEGAAWANQFDNVSNKRAHVETTGPEIWQQTNGRIDGFICAVGSGGTLAGVAEALRSRNPDIKIGLADPEGAGLYNYYANGELKSSGDSITEGIGQGRITANLEGLTVDHPYQISDAEALPYIFDLLEHEGLCLGGSSAINIAGAVRMARDLGPGKTIVTILCDYGNRYASKIFNPEFLHAKGLPVPNWMEGRTPIDISSVIEPDA